MLGRDLQVELHEAIAVMRDLIERLLESDSEDAIPELNEIELRPWGRIDINGGSPTEDPVQRLVEILQAHLADGSAPLQLRLLMSQPQQSVREFSEALMFFERPGRPVILQGLYSRASGAAYNPEAEGFSLESLATVERPDEIHQDPEPHAANPRMKLIAAASFLGVLLAVSGVLMWLNARGGTSAEAASSELSGKVSATV